MTMTMNQHSTIVEVSELLVEIEVPVDTRSTLDNMGT